MIKTILGAAPFVEASSLADLKTAGWIALGQLTSVMRKVSQLETCYEELHVAARACLRYDGVDPVRFSEAMRHMDALIQRHIAEINETEEDE